MPSINIIYFPLLTQICLNSKMSHLNSFVFQTFNPTNLQKNNDGFH